MKLSFRPSALVHALALAGVASCLVFSSPLRAAQPDMRLDWANMDPQQIQEQIRQRMVSMFKERLEITNDDEWKIVEGRLNKVLQFKAQSMLASFGLGGTRMGGFLTGDTPIAQAIRTMLGLDKVDPEVDALKKAIEAHGSNVELKAALAKVLEARKLKQVALNKAEAELREVLSLRQEASLILVGLLD